MSFLKTLNKQSLMNSSSILGELFVFVLVSYDPDVKKNGILGNKNIGAIWVGSKRYISLCQSGRTEQRAQILIVWFYCKDTSLSPQT